MQPIDIWYELTQWGNEEWFNGNKEKARTLWKIAKKYEKIQYERIFKNK